MIKVVQKYITEPSASKIAEGIERAIREQSLPAGAVLPPVRHLAGVLDVNPATVASAYRILQRRAMAVSRGRLGTRVTHRPVASVRQSVAAPTLPSHAINLADGNPDPALLPNFQRIIRSMSYRARLYGEETMHPGLVKIMRRELKRDGIHSDQLCVVNGTMDGLDRLISEELRPGDAVAVEDPGFTGHHVLIASRGLNLVPVRMDDEGMHPESLANACLQGVKAVLVTPRAQSPTGATVSAQRARELRRVLDKYPHTLVIEDDHVAFLCDHAYEPIHNRRNLGGRWALLRSLSKAFNPDLRVSVLTGDEHTMMRVLDRLVVVERWVSMMLQAAAYAALADATIRAQVRKARATYNARRAAAMNALQSQGLAPLGRQGFNIWLPVAEETPTVQNLAARGWGVAAGERFRLDSPPGVRITVSRLNLADAERFAGDVADVLRGTRASLV